MLKQKAQPGLAAPASWSFVVTGGFLGASPPSGRCPHPPQLSSSGQSILLPVSSSQGEEQLQPLLQPGCWAPGSSKETSSLPNKKPHPSRKVLEAQTQRPQKEPSRDRELRGHVLEGMLTTGAQQPGPWGASKFPHVTSPHSTSTPQHIACHLLNKRSHPVNSNVEPSGYTRITCRALCVCVCVSF